MCTQRRIRLGLTVLLLGGIALLLAVSARAASNEEYRWDILTTNPVVIEPGGVASACASDGSSITLSGSGTFRTNSGFPQDVTGGGTWKTYAPNSTMTCTGAPVGPPTGTLTGHGTYKVTAFVGVTLDGPRAGSAS